MARKVIVIALGGNAIKQADEKGTYEEQMKNVLTTSKEIVKLLKAGFRIVVTHGNGPQAGTLLIQQEAGVKEVPSQPLDIVGGMTQGQVGYMMQQTLTNLLGDERLQIPVISVVNQVRVNEDDPDFQNPSKPVGPFYSEEEAEAIKTTKPDWVMKEVKPKTVAKRFRRVVASPDPIQNMESIAIRKMLDAGILVIASGGGGIPVVYDENKHLKGIAAVIDKDLAGEKLAEVVGADVLLILTDVQNACINYAKPDQKSIEKISYEEMKKYYDDGHFASGSMGPKVKAALRFVEYGGEKSIITSLDKAHDAILGKAGTVICK